VLVDVAADDGDTDAVRLVGVRIFDHGIDERLPAADVRRRLRGTVGAIRVRSLRGDETVAALADVPAVVAALPDDVDLLVPALTDVGGHQLPVGEADAPRVAKAPGVVFVQAFLADERVVVGDAVGLVAVAAID